MKLYLISLFFLISSAPSLARSVENPYQIGSVWGRKAFTFETRDQLPAVIATQALSVAKFLGGSAFYLGEFNGRHIMATNYHVLPGALNCYSLSFADFVLLDQAFACKTFIASFSNIELSLFEIEVGQGREKHLEGIGLAFDPYVDSRELYGLGYGRQGNPHPTRKALLLSRDDFCLPFSDQVRFLKDPDEVNPVEYKVWSQPIGCDFSHGDSGAPVLNQSGEFAGIFWTGATPKSLSIQSDSFLRTLLEKPDELIWKELSYMVPVREVVRELNLFLEANPEHRHYELIREIIE